MISTKDGFYLIKIPFDLKDEFKASLPAKYRGWDQDSRSWKVSPAGIKIAQAFLSSHFGHVEIPPLEISTAVAQTVQKTMTVEYLGQCKEREAGVISALGLIKGLWSVEFPEQVLKDWFERKTNESDGQTYYQVLCVFESATDAEIKSAHRRLARQWHPDVCSEPEAADKFRELTDAYDVLREPIKRKRYDAGLYFERESRKKLEREPSADMRVRTGSRSRSYQIQNQYYRAPLRCGVIVAEGSQRLSRFTVSKILSWDDIVDDAGRVMTASWNKHTESIEVKWI